MNILYETSITASCTNNIQLQSADGAIDLELRMPKELGGSGGPYSNPTQLYGAGHAACFYSALNHVALSKKIKLKNYKVEAIVGLGQDSNNNFGFQITLKVQIPNIEEPLAHELMTEAHQLCPYSRATEGNIDVKLELILD